MIGLVAWAVAANRDIEYAHAEALPIVDQPAHPAQNIGFLDAPAIVSDLDQYQQRIAGYPAIFAPRRATIARRDHAGHLPMPAIPPGTIKEPSLHDPARRGVGV